MKKNSTLVTLVVVALVWIMARAIAASAAGVSPSPSRTLSVERAPLADPTIPQEPTVPPEPSATPTQTILEVQVSLDAGPDPVCPSWNIYYTFLMTNTSQVESLTGVVITGGVPLGTWFSTGAFEGSSIEGQYDSLANVATWRTDSVDPSTVVRAKLQLHTFSVLATGTLITNTFSYNATELAQSGQLVSSTMVDQLVCPTPPTPTATGTPTATRTPEPTHTPTRVSGTTVYLPLLKKSPDRV